MRSLIKRAVVPAVLTAVLAGCGGGKPSSTPVYAPYPDMPVQKETALDYSHLANEAILPADEALSGAGSYYFLDGTVSHSSDFTTASEGVSLVASVTLPAGRALSCAGNQQIAEATITMNDGKSADDGVPDAAQFTLDLPQRVTARISLRGDGFSGRLKIMRRLGEDEWIAVVPDETLYAGTHRVHCETSGKTGQCRAVVSYTGVRDDAWTALVLRNGTLLPVAAVSVPACSRPGSPCAVSAPVSLEAGVNVVRLLVVRNYLDNGFIDLENVMLAGPALSVNCVNPRTASDRIRIETVWDQSVSPKIYLSLPGDAFDPARSIWRGNSEPGWAGGARYLSAGLQYGGDVIAASDLPEDGAYVLVVESASAVRLDVSIRIDGKKTRLGPYSISGGRAVLGAVRRSGTELTLQAPTTVESVDGVAIPAVK